MDHSKLFKSSPHSPHPTQEDYYTCFEVEREKFPIFLSPLQNMCKGIFLAREKSPYTDSLISLYAFTRSTYWPVRVSMRILSPGFTNRGTFKTTPVSSVAGLVTLLAVLPRTPGSALS